MEKRMLILLVVLPLAILLIALLFGSVPSFRGGLLTFTALWGGVVAILLGENPPPLLLLCCILLTLLAPLMVVLISLMTGRQAERAPIRELYEQYDHLTPAQKRSLHNKARWAAKAGCTFARMRYPQYAGILRRIRTLL